MKNLLFKTMAASGLLLMGLTANAQYQPRNEYRYTQDEREAREHPRVLDRTRNDLDTAASSALPFTGDRMRAMRAKQEVNEAQRLLASGDYDRRTFDQAINAVQRVADLNRISDGTRDNLRDDVRELRQLQARIEG